MKLADRVPVLAAALWWGGMAALGFIAVPLLFANMPLKADAGRMAAKLFTAEAWLAVGCGMVLLTWIRRASRHDLLGWVAGGMLLALLVEFAVAPRIVARENLALWHSLGSAMYVAQWLCAGTVLWKLVSAVPETPSVIPAAPSIIPAAPSVIPAAPSVIPAAPSVIPAQAGIQEPPQPPDA